MSRPPVPNAALEWRAAQAAMSSLIFDARGVATARDGAGAAADHIPVGLECHQAIVLVDERDLQVENLRVVCGTAQPPLECVPVPGAGRKSRDERARREALFVKWRGLLQRLN